jgi:hypothetical protein
MERPESISPAGRNCYWGDCIWIKFIHTSQLECLRNHQLGYRCLEPYSGPSKQILTRPGPKSGLVSPSRFACHRLYYPHVSQSLIGTPAPVRANFGSISYPILSNIARFQLFFAPAIPAIKIPNCSKTHYTPFSGPHQSRRWQSALFFLLPPPTPSALRQPSVVPFI